MPLPFASLGLPRPFRSGPPQLPRRLVALDGKVFVTLGLDAPISILDAVSGKTLDTLDETHGADEILVLGDVLLVVTYDPQEQAAQAVRRDQLCSKGSSRNEL